MIYLPIIYMLASNLCTTAGQYRRLMWTAMGAIFCNASLSLNKYIRLTDDAKSSLRESRRAWFSGRDERSLHAAHRLLRLRGMCVPQPLRARSHVPLPVVWVYFLSNRRAAFVGLLAGMVVLSVALFWRQPRTFSSRSGRGSCAARLSGTFGTPSLQRGSPPKPSSP